MTGINELYQEVILHHSKAPRNFGKPEEFDRHADGQNPLCGDEISVYLTLKDGVVQSVHFEGQGCAISTASASVMTDVLKGRTVDEAEAMFGAFHALVTGREPEGDSPELGKLEVFSGVSEFPARVKCASLAWHTFQAALHNHHQTVSTE
jgi:nitrogen fixation NifU-like protein